MGCSRSARAVWFENPLGRGELDPQFIGASLTDDVSHPNTARSNVTCAPCEAAAELLNKLGGVVQPPAGGSMTFGRSSKESTGAAGSIISSYLLFLFYHLNHLRYPPPLCLVQVFVLGVPFSQVKNSLEGAKTGL